MNNQTISSTFVVLDDGAGQRLDHVLAQQLSDYSRSQIQTWIQQGDVRVDGTVCTVKKTKLKAGQAIQLNATLVEQTIWAPQALNQALNIVYEDDALLVINKPVGLVVHPGAGQRDQTLVNALLHYDPHLAQLPRGGLIHRLDKDTTGLMVVAKTLTAHHHLVKALQARSIHRHYEAVVHGVLIVGGDHRCTHRS